VCGLPGDDPEGDLLKHFLTKEQADKFVQQELKQDEIPYFCGLSRAYVYEHIRSCRECSHFRYDCKGMC
jgi:hypothetical protein